MKKLFLVILFSLFPLILQAKEPFKSKEKKAKKDKKTTSKKKALPKKAEKKQPDRIMVTATRRDIKIFDVPYNVYILTKEEIQHRKNIRSLPALLEDMPSVMVQKTSAAQGSPFLRGFTGFRNLFLIDGIRLNNSVFRDGPNQYWGTVDPFLIEQMEIVKGPSSVLYGSDAIGGTVNVLTREPVRSQDKKPYWKRRMVYRYGTNNRSQIVRGEAEGYVTSQLGFIGGFSFRDFKDLEGGRHIGLQPKTGYQQMDGDLKLIYHLNKKTRAILAYQHNNQDDGWRSHKTIFGKSWHGTTVGSEQKRVLEQERDLVYLQIHAKDLGKYIESAKASLSYHLQQELRRRIKSSGSGDKQGFQVNSLGFWTQFVSPTPWGDLTYGLEYYRDWVNSFKRKFNADGSLKKVAIQGPVGDDSAYDLFGLFLQYEKELVTDRLVVILGGRYTHVAVNSGKVEDPNSGAQITFHDDFDSLVGSGRLLFYAHPDYLNFFMGASQAFRAPNLSDLTRLDTARSNELETPSPGLKPEKFLSLEFGSRWNFRGFQGQVAYFYTIIRDMIVRFPTGTVIGTDQEVKKANVGDGFVHGVEFNSSYEFSRPLGKKFGKVWGRWSFFANLFWVEGVVDGYPTSAQIATKEPLGRLMPATAELGLRWNRGKYWMEGRVKMVRKQGRLASRDIADTQRIPPGGTPGYTTFTIRGGVAIRKNIHFSMGVENVFNRDYRVHGSGQNEGGTQVLFQLDWQF